MAYQYGEWQLRRMWPSFPEDVAQEVEHLATRVSGDQKLALEATEQCLTGIPI